MDVEPVRLENADARAPAPTSSRRDGRAPAALRPIRAQLRPLQQADGSARWVSGATIVTAAVYGPIEAPLRAQRVDRAHLHVALTLPSNSLTVPGDDAVRSLTSSHASNAARVWEGLLSRVLAACLRLEAHPRAAVRVAIQVVNDDGGVLAACVNAAVMAAMDAGLEMVTLISAVAMAYGTGSEVLLDPDAHEEVSSNAVAVVACTRKGDVVLLHRAGGSGWESDLELGLAACAKVAAVMSTAMRRREEKVPA